MNIEIRNENEALREDPFVLECVRNILDLIEVALDKHSVHMKKDVDTVENRLAQLRDHLIDHHRRQSEEHFFGQSPTLERINTALSLIISIGYPGEGIYQVGLEETRELLSEFFPVQSG
ncbi:MAG: hypothetical protein SCH71_07065 [Desulfobulbaceae bacterium]|nr:hypothetical protein [Desulfobulbaceae bacterium]